MCVRYGRGWLDGEGFCLLDAAISVIALCAVLQ